MAPLPGTESRVARRCAHGSTACPRIPASEVCLWCGSQHRPKHFNEGTYAVVPDCDSDLRDRFSLRQHLKGSKQPRLACSAATSSCRWFIRHFNSHPAGGLDRCSRVGVEEIFGCEGDLVSAKADVDDLLKLGRSCGWVPKMHVSPCQRDTSNRESLNRTWASGISLRPLRGAENESRTISP